MTIKQVAVRRGQHVLYAIDTIINQLFEDDKAVIRYVSGHVLVLSC